MTRKTILGSLLVAATALGAGSLAAQDAEADKPSGQSWMSFESLDADGDGTVTLEEFQQRRNAMFESMDSDGDGKLSVEEIEAEAVKRARERAEAMVERFDKDGDGFLGAEEMPGPRDGGERMFKWLDQDGDGVITEEEFNQAREKMRERMDKRGSDRKDGGKMHKHWKSDRQKDAGAKATDGAADSGAEADNGSDQPTEDGQADQN
ncbi:EF-hand domain-containing protein [Pontibaca methylaminivorans]|uniref:Ca2+-binding protein, EF-hand superfamily n=1 Tax=Pontibaca methylaminivorans TaxID=515897 RepID=A0A1R3X2W6_9RHOB|nr:EF-hand domain-containing protein [Pontibaca methylaminivorans]SIT85062.1 Ca2+-binding protein, EF-hand superfamily [Pontibaca methylaminivorans]